MFKLTTIAVAAALFAASPAHAHSPYTYGFYNGPHNYVSASPAISNFIGNVVKTFHGITSYYGHGERLNRYASDGSIFNPNGMTAAHRTLPLGTKVRVTYGNYSIIVKITDRGPSARTGRVLDLSYGAAKALGIVARGTAYVQIAVLN